MSQWYEAVVWISSEFEDESREGDGERDMRDYREDSCLVSLLYLFQVPQDKKNLSQKSDTGKKQTWKTTIEQ